MRGRPWTSFAVFLAGLFWLMSPGRAETIAPPAPYSAPITFNGGLILNSMLSGNWNSANSTPGKALGLYEQFTNLGPSNGIGYYWYYRTQANTSAFDVADQWLDDVRVDPVGTGSPVYDLFFWWELSPSDTTNHWGAGTECRRVHWGNRLTSVTGSDYRGRACAPCLVGGL